MSIGQFYGIEINDFAVTVAKTALWIAESQMMKETEEIVRMHLDFLPLTSYANIVEGNALRVDWESVIAKDKLNYIMGTVVLIYKHFCILSFFWTIYAAAAAKGLLQIGRRPYLNKPVMGRRGEAPRRSPEGNPLDILHH